MSLPESRRDAIRGEVAAILDGSLGLGLGLAGPLGDDTRFFADLGLASIDAVVLGEMLQAHYKRPLPFGELMAGMGPRDQRDFRIGELVDFLQEHLD